MSFLRHDFLKIVDALHVLARFPVQNIGTPIILGKRVLAVMLPPRLPSSSGKLGNDADV